MSQFDLLSPSAVTETIGSAVGSARRRTTTTVHSGRAAGARSHVRRNVRSLLTRTLRLSIGAKAKAAHVELIRHIVGKRVSSRVESLLYVDRGSR